MNGIMTFHLIAATFFLMLAAAFFAKMLKSMDYIGAIDAPIIFKIVVWCIVSAACLIAATIITAALLRIHGAVIREKDISFFAYVVEPSCYIVVTFFLFGCRTK